MNPGEATSRPNLDDELSTEVTTTTEVKPLLLVSATHQPLQQILDDEYTDRFTVNEIQLGVSHVVQPIDSSIDGIRSEAPLSPLRVTMCRYEGRRIVKDIYSICETSYIAISHVWGPAEWKVIPDLGGDVLISDEKAKFLIERLPEVVADEIFWMDVLCLDQRDAEARVAVTQHIPQIFRSATRTIVVRESKSFRPCCGEAIAGHAPWSNSCLVTLRKHHETHHNGLNFRDGVLSRLWPLQEVLLSDTLQFVQSECVDPQIENADISKRGSELSARDLLLDIVAFAQAWASYGIKRADNEFALKMAFTTAFLRCTVQLSTDQQFQTQIFDGHLDTISLLFE